MTPADATTATTSDRLKKHLSGTVTVPGDKSISHRALMLAAVTPGQTRITGLATNNDVMATKTCMGMLGAHYQETSDGLLVTGCPQLTTPSTILDAHNSGTTIRLLSGLLAGQQVAATLTGDASLQKRPMGRIIDPLSLMGATVTAQPPNNTAPIIIVPSASPLSGIQYTLPVASAQVKSAILLAGLWAELGQTVTITEPEPSRDHTERMFRWMGLTIEQHGNTITCPTGQGPKLQPRPLDVPGDFSSAAFLMVAALCMPGSSITLTNVGLNPYRTGLYESLKKIGASVDIQNTREQCGEPVGDMVVYATNLTGDIQLQSADIPALVDEIPILAVLGLFCDGRLTVHGAEELRKKESDRIAAIATEFAKLGIVVEEFEDGFTLVGLAPGQVLNPTAPLETYHDHRIAMSLYVLNNIALSRGLTQSHWDIQGREWMSVSYPHFEHDFEHLLQG